MTNIPVISCFVTLQKSMQQEIFLTDRKQDEPN